MALSPGFRLGPYSILSELGKGGMGEVYRARDTRLNRDVAIKVLPEHMVNDPDALSRFEREAKALAALSHPNILTIFDVGADQGFSFVVMELLEGKTLRARILRSGLSWPEALEIAVTIAEGLSAAHSKGIVHRDLKPENVFLTSDDRIKILDFGLARLTAGLPPQELAEAATRSQELESVTVSGTVPYMSPEQITGKGVDARSDIFSFGCVLYEMLTATRPFSGDSSAETIAAILKEDPRPPAESGKQVPPELERVLLRCLEKNPDRRFQTTRDLTFALRELLNTSEIPKTAVSRGKLNSRAFRIGLAITVLAVLVAGVSVYRFTGTAKAIDSLAILPFANASGDPNLEYLSDGITESLINNLSQLSQLRVMARTTVFAYKGRDADPRKVGQQLKVRAVLTGKLTRIEDTLIIQGELVDAEDGSQLWGEQYSRKFTDILTIQTKVATEIADKLRYKLTGEQEKLLSKHYTQNTEAYQLYLKGRYFWNKRSPDGLKKSMEYYQQAIVNDPGFALAYAGLSDSYQILPIIIDAPPKESYPKAKAAVARALELDETLVEAHAAMLTIKSNYDWDWSGVEREYKRIIQLNANYPQAHGTYASYLSRMGRYTEAIREMKRAQELDPLSLIANTVLGRMYYIARQYDQAIEQFRKTLEIDSSFQPALVHLGRAYKEKAMYQQAISELSKVSDHSGHYAESISLKAYTYALMGKRAEAQKLLDELIERGKRRYVSPYHIAVAYSGLGDKDAAFEWLQKAYEDRSQWVTHINVLPEFDHLRADPRFADLLRQLDLQP